MILIGSRSLGVNNNDSDYDYVELVDIPGSTYHDIKNVYFGENSHCYYYPREYIYKVARFEIDDPNDIGWMHNVEDYLAGVFDINPFDYIDKWKAKLKDTESIERCLCWKNKRVVWRKRFYHIVFNYFCIKENTLHPSEYAMSEVKRFHDRKTNEEDYINILENIKKL